MAWCALSLCAALLAGCASTTPAEFAGGLREEWLDQDSLWVRFEGTAGLNPAAVEQTLLRRAAEVTLAHGFTHFVVAGRGQQAGVGFVLRPGALGPLRGGERALIIDCYVSDPGVDGAVDARAWRAPPEPPDDPQPL